MSAEMDAGARGPQPRPRTRRRRRARFEIGRVLGTGFSIWFRGLPAFVALTAVVFAPYALLRWWAEVLQPSRAASWTYIGVSALIQQLLALVVSATVIYAVFQRLRGRRVGVWQSITYGLGRLPAVFGVSLLVALVTIVIWVPVALLVGLGIDLGAGLLAIPSLVVYVVVQCGLWVAVPACVVERPGLTESLRRSWTLTKGSKAAIFLLLILFGIASAVLGFMTTILVSAITNDDSASAQVLLSLALAVVMTSLTAVVNAVGYHELRLAVDGIDAGELAAIFD